MAANARAGILTWVLGGIIILALAGCSTPAAPLETATPLIATEAQTASPPPASATPAATATVAPSLTVIPSQHALGLSHYRNRHPYRNFHRHAGARDGHKCGHDHQQPGPDRQRIHPTARSIWDTGFVGGDTMTGDCPGPVNPVYGLVQITPQGNTLLWKNQEPAPYTMTRVRANLWQYSGPTSINDGTVTMDVTNLPARPPSS